MEINFEWRLIISQQITYTRKKKRKEELIWERKYPRYTSEHRDRHDQTRQQREPDLKAKTEERKRVSQEYTVSNPNHYRMCAVYISSLSRHRHSFQ